MILLINPLSSVKHDIIWYSIDDCNGKYIALECGSAEEGMFRSKEKSNL